jgi:hypothetical protein
VVHVTSDTFLDGWPASCFFGLVDSSQPAERRGCYRVASDTVRRRAHITCIAAAAVLLLLLLSLGACVCCLLFVVVVVVVFAGSGARVLVLLRVLLLPVWRLCPAPRQERPRHC